jgi:hypothetical protein
MARADIMAGKAYVSLYVKQNEFTKALKNAQRQLNDFGSGVAKIGASISAAGAAITGSMTGALMHFASVGDELDKMSQRTGVSATALAELGFAAEQSGADMETVESALKRMQKNLGGVGPESGKAVAALDMMGLSIEKIQAMSPEDQFQAIAEGIAGISDPSARAAAAMSVFGEGGRQLLPMVENIRELRQEARDLGIAPSPESVAAAAQITDAINRVRRVVSATIFEIGAAIAPMAADVLAGFLSVVSAVRKFVVANKTLIVTIAKVGVILSGIGAAIVAIGGAFIAAGMAVGAVLSAISAFGSAIALAGSLLSAMGAILGLVFTPVGLIAAVLIGGAVAWLKFSETGKAAVSSLVTGVTGLFASLRETVTSTFGGIVDAIRAGDLALAGQIAMVGLRLAVMQSLEAIHDLFGSTIGTIVGQIANGDLAGAWATLGSGLLTGMASVANMAIGIWATAINSIASLWRKTSDAITNDILQRASKGGLFGKIFEKFSGVDMQKETKRAQDLEAQRRSMGLNPQTDDIASQIAAGTYKDPGIAAIEANIKAATAAIEAGAQEMTDATQAAFDQAVDGQAGKASAGVQKLQEELATLRAEAAAKLAAGKDGRVDGASASSSASGGSAGTSGRASVASNSLLALSAMAAPQDRQARLLEKQIKQADMQLIKQDMLIAAVQGGGLVHA